MPKRSGDAFAFPNPPRLEPLAPILVPKNADLLGDEGTKRRRRKVYNFEEGQDVLYRDPEGKLVAARQWSDPNALRSLLEKHRSFPSTNGGHQTHFIHGSHFGVTAFQRPREKYSALDTRLPGLDMGETLKRRPPAYGYDPRF